jgi:nucleoside-diphosphate-sugar epimerase
VKLLLLGAPRFLGRAIADAALARDHEVTFFNRGRTNPELYPEVERLVGDRAGDLAPLRGRRWDAVVDTSGYLPGTTRASAEAVADSGLYCFVSSVSVYADFTSPIDEDSPVAQLGDLPDDEVTNESYGALKALCEDAVRDVFGARALIVRSGLITGPFDPTGRFTYWPHRIARGGEVLAPDAPDEPMQSIDVRDLGDWVVSSCDAGLGGNFNATHPGFGWEALLDACVTVSGREADITWVSREFLVEQEVGEWMELPLWLADPGFADRVSVQRALEAGLTFRPLEETVRGALEQAQTTDAVGLAPEREAALLAEWHGRG